MKHNNAYIKCVEYSCASNDPLDYGSSYRCNKFAFLFGTMPECAEESQHHPVMMSEEITTEYDSVIEYSAISAVYSFRRSRRWNIRQLCWYLSMGLAEGDEEGFFRYHAVQLCNLFGNTQKYRSAMREIERRCALPSGTAYHPDVLKAFREGRHDEYNALSGHCDEIVNIELAKSVDDEFENWADPCDDSFEDVWEPIETQE